MRLRTIVPVLLIAFALSYACDDDSGTGPHNPVSPDSLRYVVLKTSMGDIKLELFPNQAPITVANFKRYASEGFYNGLVFHRVISTFVLQAGAYDSTLTLKPPTYPPISNEAGNGLSNVRGTISMVHSVDPQSASTQFFINVEDNLFLDHKDDTPQGYGYAVFGHVVDGMDVVDAIRAVPTGSKNGFNDVPVTPVLIRRVIVGRPLFFIPSLP